MAPLRPSSKTPLSEPSTTGQPSREGNDEAEEDDYLTMSLEEPATTTKHETLTQHRKRLAREAEARARPKSKAEIAEEERTKREAALAKSSLDTSSKGFKMMAALGYKPGTALGARISEPGATEGINNSKQATDSRLLEPIALEMKEGRSGIGADAEKKRKIREAFAEQEQAAKRVQVDAGEFRERQVREREEKRHEAQWWGAMKVAEKLDEETGEETQRTSDDKDTEPAGPHRNNISNPLKSINILWRPLSKFRATKDRDARMRADLNSYLSPTPRTLPTSNTTADFDADDKIALGLGPSPLSAPSSLTHNSKTVTIVDAVDLDEEDEELEAYEALPAGERLEQVVGYLRERWRYCFWCKYRYDDEGMEGCPGISEDDHD